MTIKSSNAGVSEDIPVVATVVEVVESDTNPPATNPDHRTTTTTTPASLEVEAGMSDSRKKAVPKNLGRTPYGIQCPHCNRETITIVEDRVGTGTILATVALVIVFWPLCWIPFCLPTCKQTYHFCGHKSCRKRIGVTQVCA